MRERQLGIVKRAPTGTIGVCEHCNARFESCHPLPDYAEKEIQAAFDAHRCEETDGGPYATRSVGCATQALAMRRVPIESPWIQRLPSTLRRHWRHNSNTT